MSISSGVAPEILLPMNCVAGQSPVVAGQRTPCRPQPSVITTIYRPLWTTYRFVDTTTGYDYVGHRNTAVEIASAPRGRLQVISKLVRERRKSPPFRITSLTRVRVPVDSPGRLQTLPLALLRNSQARPRLIAWNGCFAGLKWIGL